MAEQKTTNRRGKCRFCATEQTVMPNDGLVDHPVSPRMPNRLCFGSGLVPAK